MKKYRLTGRTKKVDGVILHQIEALKEFATYSGKVIMPGTLGGWIEKGFNLSQYGHSWVDETSFVYGEAMVCDDAEVLNHSLVRDNAIVHHRAAITNAAKIYDRVDVGGDAVITGNIDIIGYAHISGDANVSDYSHYIVIGPIGYYKNILSAYITFYLTKNNEIAVKCDWFSGSIKDFVKEVKRKYNNIAYYTIMKQYLQAVKLAKKQIKMKE